MDCWGFFNLPPFFTPQPAPATYSKQCVMWAQLILEHASFHGAASNGDICRVLRYYSTTSDVFHNASIHRRLSESAAQRVLESVAELQPNHIVYVAGEVPGVLVASNRGGFKELSQSLVDWVLEMGQGTTSAMLGSKGAVLTFDELAAGKCLEYKISPGAAAMVASAPSKAAAKVVDAGALTQEQSVRLYLEAVQRKLGTVTIPYRMALFNLDGSDEQPYQGVKIGGS